MAAADEFAAECKTAARLLRRTPKDLRKALSSEVKDKVATPLAAKVGAAATGPHARVLQAGTKARAAGDPTIVVGGMRPKLSGGAGPRQVVFGNEFGGGKRLGKVRASSRAKAHRRYTTRQFAGKQRPFVFPTISSNLDWVLDEFADITMTTIDKAVNGRG